MLQNLPLGMYDFREIRTRNYKYIDKTKYIHRFCTTGKYYFYARPRRFGKSMTLSVVSELYKGSKELFEGLWIENNWDWTRKHPIFQLSFKSLSYKTQGLEVSLSERMIEIAKNAGFNLSTTNSKDNLRELLIKLSATNKVVVLIDEYDAPILDYMDKDIAQSIANRDLLKDFYTVLKECDACIELVFITGISKFAKVGIFSGMNNLTDMSMHPEYATMLGYTQAELEENFEDYLIDVANKKQITKEALLDKMRFWYNGYRFNENEPTVYNPVSTNLFFNFREFKNFWFETGTPTHLINHLKKNGIYNLKLEEIPETAFNSFGIEKISTYGLLFQAGYLTIKSVDEFGFYTLDYPNYEVEHSLTGYLLDAYGEFQQSEGVIFAVKIEKAFAANDIEKVVSILQTMFKSIPNQLFINNHNEAFYHTMVHLMFKYMGVVIQSEVNTSDGRCDAIVTTKTHIYILEFKLDQTPEAAFAQILNKDYATAFAQQNKEIIGIGVNFSNENKNITGFFAQNI